MSYSSVTADVIRDLTEILGPSAITAELEKCQAYTYDEVLPCFYGETYRAEAICFPESTEQVSAIMKYANEHLIPVTPRGAGTGLSGGAVPVAGGIVLSLERMNQILEVDVENLTLTAEPGVVTSEITKAAASRGLFYAGDPCSGDASFIGGNVADNAGGNKVTKYGTTGAHVLALEAVLADGSVLQFGGKRRKDVTGYDFVHLLVGSEGTLAVITKITLNLLPSPGRVIDLLIPMKSIRDAMDLVPSIATECKVTPSSVEFMDKKSIQLVERYLNTKIPFDDAQAHLIIQLEGMDAEQLWANCERVGDLCLQRGALEVFVAEDRNARERLWRARKLAAEAVWAAAAVQLSNEDIVVPTSEIAVLMDEFEKICFGYDIKYAAYGHAGDGNIHLTLYLDEERPDQKQLGEAAQRDLYHLVKKLGGTLTGEHGVGAKRTRHVPLFLDEPHIHLIHRVKLAFDPNNILNPRKIIPEQS